ncbi:MAG: hypothetical protein GVY18_04500 [Bacteroidetes bacterium]|jgi:hypothetical protein|nr:hypothetical protein [Bacteroidota bacterium]
MADITIQVEPRAVPEIEVPPPDVPDILVGGAVWSEILGKPSTFAPAPHTHPISEVANLQAALDGKATLSHTHDDRYYTEQEVDQALAQKASTDALTEADATGDPPDDTAKLVAGDVLAAVIAALASGGGIETVGTEAEILATTPDAPVLAFGTDTGRVYLYDGAGWHVSARAFGIDGLAMGPNPRPAPDGYGRETVLSKRLSGCRVGRKKVPQEGGLRVTEVDGRAVLQAYLNERYNALPDYFEADRRAGTLYYVPGDWLRISVYDGTSEQVGIDGHPIAQGGTITMGAYGG